MFLGIKERDEEFFCVFKAQTEVLEWNDTKMGGITHTLIVSNMVLVVCILPHHKYPYHPQHIHWIMRHQAWATVINLKQNIHIESIIKNAYKVNECGLSQNNNNNRKT